MKRRPDDTLLGAILAVALIGALWGTLGPQPVLGLLLGGLVAEWAVRLWTSGNAGARWLAALLLPTVLLVALVPRRIRRALREWRAEGTVPRQEE